MSDHDEEQLQGGYYTKLAAKFTTPIAQIERNYMTLIKLYTESHSTKEITRTTEAFDILKNETTREQYMHQLTILCYLSQPFDLLVSKKDNAKLWPFFIFEVIKEGKATSEIMQFNFVKQTITEQIKEIRSKNYSFSNISSALFSKKDDEFIINFIENGKMNSQNYKAKFQNQRDCIVKLVIYAKEVFEETKPILEFHNDPIMVKPTEQVSAKSHFLENDSYIPPKEILKTKAEKQATLKSKVVYLILGKTQLILSRDAGLQNIIQVVPIKKEYLACSYHENVVTLQILNMCRKYRFNDKHLATQFIQKMNMIQAQKCHSPNLFTQHPAQLNLQIIAQIQQDNIQRINQQIESFEAKIRDLKLQRQSIYSELENIDFNHIDENQLIIKDSNVEAPPLDSVKKDEEN